MVLNENLVAIDEHCHVTIDFSFSLVDFEKLGVKTMNWEKSQNTEWTQKYAFYDAKYAIEYL